MVQNLSIPPIRKNIPKLEVYMIGPGGTTPVAIHFQPPMLISLARLKRATHQIKAESKINFEILKFKFVEND